MTSKLIELHSCSECSLSSTEIVRTSVCSIRGALMCNHPDAPDDCEIDEGDDVENVTIPDWCPLKDAETRLEEVS